MAEFNPYQAWLQVPVAAGDTPTYYQLLGLAEYEENPQTISKAAEKQLSRLLAINPEKHRPQWQKLINDLAEAQSTLTHPEHKTSYDNRLRGISAPTAESSAYTSSIPTAPTVAPTSTPTNPAYPAAPYQAQPYQAVPAAPLQPAPYAPNPGYPSYGQPSYQSPAYPTPSYANPGTGQPQYAQLVYGQPVYGQQPPPAPPAQPYRHPGYGQPAYGQAPYAPPAAPPYGQPAYGQPVSAQPVYGQPPTEALYAQPPYGAPPYNPAPAYDAAPAANPNAPANLPNPMAPLSSVPNYGSLGAGETTAVVNPMAPLNNARSSLPGTSQNYVEEDSSFGTPLPTPNPYRAPRTESPVKYLVGGIAAVVVLVGGLILNAKLGKKDDEPVAKNTTPPAIKNGKNPPEVVPVSTPTEPKNTEPKQPEPMPVQPEPMSPELTKPEPAMPEPVKPAPVQPEPMKPEMTTPAPAMPEPVKPAPTQPEPMKPEMTKPEVTKPEPAMPEPPKPEPPKPEPTVATPEQQKEIFAKLAEVRVLLGERKFPEAKQALAKVKELAMTPDMQELHIGMELVVDYAEQFWQAVQSSMRTLKGEIMVGSSLANVVNSEASEITIRIAGANKNFKFTNLPPGLALAIAQKWFDNKPANKAVLGAFYYVSKTGSIDEARKYWNEAGSGGIDVKFMQKLLDKPAIHGK